MTIKPHDKELTVQIYAHKHLALKQGAIKYYNELQAIVDGQLSADYIAWCKKEKIPYK